MYYAEKAALARNNISKSWAFVDEIIKRKKIEKAKISRIYDDEGKEITDETKIVNLINQHFSTIGDKMAEKVPVSTTDPLKYVLLGR